MFHISTTVETKKNIGSKSKPKTTLTRTRCLHSKDFALLAPSFARQDFIWVAYEAVGMENRYLIGTEVGPLVATYWVGAQSVAYSFHPQFALTKIHRGGANTSITIANDQQWTGFKNSLRDTPKSVVEVRVILKSSELNRWKRSTATTV